jgi:hypothetical protein
MAAKLTDTQLVILSAAAQRDDHAVLPLAEVAQGEQASRHQGAQEPDRQAID